MQGEYVHLKWSHYYAAVNWDDSAECLQWANDLGATVAEMKAWRRSQRGEDLTQPAAEGTAVRCRGRSSVHFSRDGDRPGVRRARPGASAVPVAATASVIATRWHRGRWWR
ncbi:MAG: hypothetical protein R3B90_04825 [Planctomycetaceae bacterium]